MKDLKAIIFDFDGVIVESVEVKTWAFRKLFERYPRHVDKIAAYHMDHGGISRFTKIRYIFKGILKKPLSEKFFDQLCRRYSQLVYNRVVASPLVPGAQEFLKKYYKKFPLFVVSGTPRGEMIDIAEAKNLTRYFMGIFGSPETKEYWTRKILDRFKLKPREVLFVGDARSDYQTAKKMKIPFVARIPDGSPGVFGRRKIQHAIKDLYELDAIVTSTRSLVRGACAVAGGISV